MKTKVIIFTIVFGFSCNFSNAQSEDKEAKLNKMRAESGVDPTRTTTRAGFYVLYFDQSGDRNLIQNRFDLTLGVKNWGLSIKADLFNARSSGIPGTKLERGLGDTKFNISNSFYHKGGHSMAAAVEFITPTGAEGIGGQYFAVAPSVVWTYSISPGLFMAVQPQYRFSVAKAPLYPDLNMLSIRIFLAKFTKSGYFFVIEPRPVFNFQSNSQDLIIAPIIGKALGNGFNLILTSEIPTKQSTIDNTGILVQFGFNKNF